MQSGELSPLLSFLIERLEVGIFAVDAEMRIVLWNRFMAVHSSQKSSDLIGKNLFEAFPDLPVKWLEKKIKNVFILKNYAFTSWEQRPYLFRFHHNRPITGGVDTMQQNCTFLPVNNDQDEVEYVCITLFDFTDTAIFQQQLNTAIEELGKEKAEQQALIKKLEDAQNQLQQSEKLASIGQLAAGVAHEINNPVGFVNSNVGSLDGHTKSLLELIAAYENAAAKLAEPSAEFQAVEELKKKIDFEYLKEDIGDLIRESKEGLGRVKKIVQDLKDFSHVDNKQEWQFADLHKCIDSTLNVVWNEVKFKAEVEKNYGNIPEVECLASQLNQVFMNLIVNASHAIAERGKITITTSAENDWVCVAVKDTGSGIAPEHLKNIFDPFFTTKPVGTGTGLGLSVSYNIITKHGGRIEVDSVVGTGTTFSIHLPVKHPQIPEDA